MKKLTLTQLLAKLPDGDLLEVQEELMTGLVPATGATQSFRRKLNKMIDKGELCINPTTYRKIYLPTLAKAVQQEFAARYAHYLKHHLSEDHQTFGLVKNDEQQNEQETTNA